MPVDPEKRQEFLGWLATEYGEDIVVTELAKHQDRIPFESPMLTWATCGGVPIGHMCRWYGPEGSGKSLTNWGLISAAQRYPEIITELFEADIHWLEKRGNKFASLKRKKDMERLVARFPDGMSAIIFDTEQRANLELAAQVGVNVKRDVLEIIDEQIIEYIIDQMKAAIEAYHIVIVDSASNAESIQEDEQEPGDYRVGSAARMWTRLKQVRKRFDRAENTMIIVDQMRTNIQMSTLGKAARNAGPPTAPPNIRFLRHNSSLSIEFDVGTKLYLDKNDNLTDDYEKASSDYKALGTNGKEPHGLEMRCKVQKNSTGRPYRNSRMRFRFPVADIRTGELKQEIGFDREFELLEIAVHFEIIESGGGGMYYLLDEDFERLADKTKDKKVLANVRWKGESAARLALAEDDELRDRIMQRLMADM